MNGSERLENLLNWAKSHHAVINPSIKFTYLKSKGISAFKLSSLNDSNDDYQIQIPEQLIITYDKSFDFFQMNYPKFLNNYNNSNHKYSNVNSIIKLYLSFLKFNKATSFFQPYVDCLPTDIDLPNSPLLWNNHDKKLLKGTNLGATIDLKLILIIKEWYEVVKVLIDSQDDLVYYKQELEFYEEYFNKGEISQLVYLTLEKFNKKLNNLLIDKKVSWISFESYLWSHLMITSRSFPKKVISNDPKDSSAILLPIIDLLNHKVMEKVKWGKVNNNFGYKNDNFDKLSIGEEIFNNYGLKNNEELLLGYGFLIKDNQFETCALKLKLSINKISEISHTYPELKLPVPNDYSNLVSNNITENDSKFNDGLLYFLSLSNPIPDELIKIFAILNKNDYDEYYIKENPKDFSITNRMVLQGINNLQIAIETKLNNLKTEKNHNKFDPLKEKIVKEYKKSQEKVFSNSLKHLKSMSKKVLKDLEIDGKILTIKKIFNKDIKFQDGIHTLLNNPESENDDSEDIFDRLISPETSTNPESSYELIEQIIILWLGRCNNKNFYPEYRIQTTKFDDVLPNYLFELFLWFKIDRFTSTDFTKDELNYFEKIHNTYFPEFSETCPELFGVGSWKSIDLVIAGRIFDYLKFSRVGKNEIYLIENSYFE